MILGPPPKSTGVQNDTQTIPFLLKSGLGPVLGAPLAPLGLCLAALGQFLGAPWQLMASQGGSGMLWGRFWPHFRLIFPHWVVTIVHSTTDPQRAKGTKMRPALTTTKA